MHVCTPEKEHARWCISQRLMHSYLSANTNFVQGTSSIEVTHWCYQLGHRTTS